jgi:hypothetical protein
MQTAVTQVRTWRYIVHVRAGYTCIGLVKATQGMFQVKLLPSSATLIVLYDSDIMIVFYSRRLISRPPFPRYLQIRELKGKGADRSSLFFEGWDLRPR